MIKYLCSNYFIITNIILFSIDIVTLRLIFALLANVIDKRINKTRIIDK